MTDNLSGVRERRVRQTEPTRHLGSWMYRRPSEGEEVWHIDERTAERRVASYRPMLDQAIDRMDTILCGGSNQWIKDLIATLRRPKVGGEFEGLLDAYGDSIIDHAVTCEGPTPPDDGTKIACEALIGQARLAVLSAFAAAVSKARGEADEYTRAAVALARAYDHWRRRPVGSGDEEIAERNERIDDLGIAADAFENAAAIDRDAAIRREGE